ncbi:MAG: endonuclease V [Candidatus Bathyarchaeia archaeon]
MTAVSGAIGKFSISKAHKAQKYLSKKIIIEDRFPNKISFVAGVDVAYAGDLAVGAAAVLDYETLETLEVQTATCKVRFPYVPTLLSFREVPPSVACIKRLKRQPDVLLVDGQGVAHPYRCGFASHLGLAISKPTVGVAKSRLSGDIMNGFLVENGQVIGAVVTTHEGQKPVYVSVGHLISLETAMQIVRRCFRRSRMPEPIWQAHCLAKLERQRLCRRVGLEKV